MAHLIQAGMRSTHSPYAVSTRAFTFVLRHNRQHLHACTALLATVAGAGLIDESHATTPERPGVGR